MRRNEFLTTLPHTGTPGTKGKKQDKKGCIVHVRACVRARVRACVPACACVKSMRSCLSVTLGTVARQAPLSMGILQARVLEWVSVPSPGDVYCDSPCIKYPEEKGFERQKSDWWVTGAGVGEIRSHSCGVLGFLFGGMETFWNQIDPWIAQHCACTKCHSTVQFKTIKFTAYEFHFSKKRYRWVRMNQSHL